MWLNPARADGCPPMLRLSIVYQARACIRFNKFYSVVPQRKKQRLVGAAALQQATFGERHACGVADHQMIQQADVD